MFRKSVFIAFLLTAITGGGAGIQQLSAQENLERSDKAEMEYAISTYQSGGQGDVIRYLMQRGYEGSVAAQFNLGVINHLREDQSIGAKEALFWFAEAAEEGDLVAQMNLGILKIDIGLATQDAEQLDDGARWLRRSAESGLRSAQVNLGGLIALGLLDSPHNNEGNAWLNLAFDAGDPRASSILQKLAESAETKEVLALLYPVDEQMRSEPYRGGSKVTTADAPVYAEPSAEMQPIATISADALVEVLDRSGGWVSVKIPAGLPVWISAGLVKVEADLVRVDRLEAPLYSAPDNSADAVSLGTVTKGETLALIEDQGDWLIVRSPERFGGWMKQSDVASKIPLILASEEQVSATVGSVENEPKISDSLAVSAVMISDAELFQTPERQSKLLGVLASSAEIQVSGSADGFVFVEGVQASGWVSKSLVKIGRQSAAEGIIAMIDTDVVRVRSRPDIESVGFGRLLRGQEALVIDETDKWVRVVLGMGSGWVVSQLVELRSSSQAKAGTEAVDVIHNTDTAKSLEDNLVAAIEDDQVVGLSEQPQPPLSEEVGEEEQLLSDTTEPVNESDSVVPEKSEDLSTSVVQAAKEQQSVEEAVLPAVKVDAVLYSENSTLSRPLGRVLSSPTVADNNAAAMYQVARPVQIYGWVFATLAREQGDQIEINSNGVRIRLDPTTERNNIVGARNRGDRLRLLERENGWLKVALEPAAGWLLSSDIE